MSEQHIDVLAKMREEARYHYSKAVSDHSWRDTQDKWRDRIAALDAAIAALAGTEPKPPPRPSSTVAVFDPE